jgi:hypothetical protein
VRPKVDNTPGADKAMRECDRPFPLERIRLEAPGQVLIDVPARYLQHFGKRQDGVHSGTRAPRLKVTSQRMFTRLNSVSIIAFVATL